MLPAAPVANADAVKMKKKSEEVMANEIGGRLSKSAIFGIGSARREKEKKWKKRWKRRLQRAAFSPLISDIYIYIIYTLLLFSLHK